MYHMKTNLRFDGVYRKLLNQLASNFADTFLGTRTPYFHPYIVTHEYRFDLRKSNIFLLVYWVLPVREIKFSAISGKFRV